MGEAGTPRLEVQGPGFTGNGLSCQYANGSKGEDAVGESPAQPPDTAGDADTGRRAEGRPKVGWRGRLTGLLTGLAAGMTVNDLSGTLGYRGLAGVAAITGVVAAAVWIRGLDARALLPRYASWLFLVPAATAAMVAAFSSRSGAGLLTVVAIALTVGAVLLTTNLDTAAGVLGSAAVIGGGVALIGGGTAVMADRGVLVGVAVIAVGVAIIGYGAAVMADSGVLVGVAFIGGGVALIGLGAAVMASRGVLVGVAVIGLGVATIGYGAAGWPTVAC